MQFLISATYWRGFQAFFDPIVTTFGWSRGATAAAVSLQRVEGGILSPFVGPLILRYGPRKVMLLGIAVTGSSFIILSHVTALWQFYVAMALLTFGMSLGTFIVLVSTVSNWFIKRRARAVAILMSFSALGGLTVPILVTSIDSFGWRSVLVMIGIAIWVVGFPSAMVMRRPPEYYGQKPDGESSDTESVGLPRSTGSFFNDPNLGVRQVLKTRFFWQFAFVGSLGRLVSAASVLHLPALRDSGVSPGLAALSVGMLSIGDLIGRMSVGWIGDRVDKRWFLAGSYSLMGMGILALALVNSELLDASWLRFTPLPIFVLGFGVGFGISVPLRFTMLADYVGRRSFASLLGLTGTVGEIFAASGPIFVGLTYDITGSYRPAFFILAAAIAVAVPLSFSLEKPAVVMAKVRARTFD